MNGKPVLISGGGLGGLTTALALGQRGHAVRVLEQAPQFGAIGYGIQLGPNVLSAFDELGLTPAVTAAAHYPPAILMLDARDGSEIVRISISTASICMTFCLVRVVLRLQSNSSPTPGSSRSRRGTTALSR
jgi:2-polyprenyl-6-methoxyphenol hydroxylase-like FAD-dependent oxidoreductase